MANDEPILKRWGFPYRQDHGVTLVARHHTRACVERIYAGGCRFYGFDSFRVIGATIQPILEFSPDWSRDQTPRLEEVVSQLESHPSMITHYEFVFEDPL